MLYKIDMHVAMKKESRYSHVSGYKEMRDFVISLPLTPMPLTRRVMGLMGQKEQDIAIRILKN